ncbi:MAG: hypothetical protein HY301_13230 [Verrucomicrobia bacterium]|nr:hypothetical protein [Verrucomicrobiota bacterium]
MPRPDYIANLHGAKYDLRFCSGADKAKFLSVYRTALEEAQKKSGLSSSLLEAAVARDFFEWMKQERLPKPPQKEGK